MIRLPFVCNHNPETTVLAHYRMKGDGMGRKPPDSRGAFACSACHDAVDSRVIVPYTRDEMRIAHAEGVFRTQEYVKTL